MALSDYSPPHATVTLPGGKSFDVRGLSLDDLTQLLTLHRDDFMAAIALFDTKSDQPAEFALELVKVVPDLVASAVALAADEPGARAVVRKLPGPLLLDTIMQVGQLTFTDEGALPKFLANLTALLGGVGKLGLQKTH